MRGEKRVQDTLDKALFRLAGTTLSVANVMKCLDLGFKAEIRITEVKINSTKPTSGDVRCRKNVWLFSSKVQRYYRLTTNVEYRYAR